MPASRRPRSVGRLLVGAAALSLLAGCNTTPAAPQDANKLFGLITPYRMEIVQGNVITSEQVARVRPGMTREQVKELLGTPLLASLFHADRWDYVFTIRRQGAEPQRRGIVVWFKGDVLERIEAPDLPSEREFVADISNVPPPTKIPQLELTPEQRAALPVPPAASAPQAASTTAPAGAARTYPPLEP